MYIKPVLIERQMIKLDPNVASMATISIHQLTNSLVEIVPPPVSVNNIVSISSSPGLSSIYQSGDSAGVTLQRNHQAIRSSEGTVDKVGEIRNIVVRSENTALQILFSHQIPKIYLRHHIFYGSEAIESKTNSRSLQKFYLRLFRRLSYSLSEKSLFSFDPFFLNTVLSAKKVETSWSTLILEDENSRSGRTRDLLGRILD